MPPRSDIGPDPTLELARDVWQRGLEALTRPPAASPAHIDWLRRQKPVGMQDGWVLLAYPNEIEARVAHATEATVRLSNRLRAARIAEGVRTCVVPAKTVAPAPAVATRPPWERRPVYMPSFLVSTTLPHRDPKAPEFTRVNGSVITTLHAPRRIGVPFGVYARLILMHIATRATVLRSPRLRLGRSVNEFLARMGIRNSGGDRGESTRSRNQLDRICATTFTTTHLSPYGGSNLVVADRWMEATAAGVEVHLSDRFFEQVTRSAVPLDPVILKTLRQSPLSIDLYGWLTHRARTLHEPARITWPSIQRQFGSEYSRRRDFRRKFEEHLTRVSAAWPLGPRVDVEALRVVLHPTPPSVGSYIDRSNAKHG